MCWSHCFRCVTFGLIFFICHCGVNAVRPHALWDACEPHGGTTLKKTSTFDPTECRCHWNQVPSKGCGDFYQDQDEETAEYYNAFYLGYMPDKKSCKCEEPCSKFRAETPDDLLPGTSLPSETCQCSDKKIPAPSCGKYDENYVFVMKNVPEPDSCKCLSPEELASQRSVPVQVAALQFCKALVKVVVPWGREGPAVVKLIPALRDLSPELCREVLTGTVANDNWYSQAAELSQHPGTEGLGHLDPLVKRRIRKHHLQNVCKDECEDIVRETKKKAWVMFKEVDSNSDSVFIPYEATCADQVVRRVEAEILGCCGRSCGWNNRSCMSWPFFTKTEKIEWLEECCTEFNVLNGSSRERMCNSVLTPEQVELVSKLDTNVKNTDVGGAYTGQDRRLIWTKAGLFKFDAQLKKQKTVPKDGDLVDSEFLEENHEIRQKGLQNGWFREEEEVKGNKGTSTTMLQTGGGLSDGCNLKGMDTCHEDTKRLKVKKCMAGAPWQVSDKPNADLDEETCQMIQQNKAAIQVSTPDECLKAKFSTRKFGKITRRFFEYKEGKVRQVGKTLKDVLPDKPIMCYVESVKYTCGDFVREKFDQGVLDSKEFHEFRYWIDEEDVPKRLKQIPQDDAFADAQIQ